MIKAIRKRIIAGPKKSRDYSVMLSEKNKKPIVHLLRDAARQANKDQLKTAKNSR